MGSDRGEILQILVTAFQLPGKLPYFLLRIFTFRDVHQRSQNVLPQVAKEEPGPDLDPSDTSIRSGDSALQEKLSFIPFALGPRFKNFFMVLLMQDIPPMVSQGCN